MVKHVTAVLLSAILLVYLIELFKMDKILKFNESNASLKTSNEPKRLNHALNLTKEEKMFYAKSFPIINPGGQVIWKNREKNYIETVAHECNGPFCRSQPKEWVPTVYLDTDIIVCDITFQYFHHYVENALRLWTLKIHNILDKYPNASVLWFHGYPNKANIGFMHTIWPEFPMHRSIRGKPELYYHVGHLNTIIVPRFNDYHVKDPWWDYNYRLITSIRQTVGIVDNPIGQLYISRGGQDKLYFAIKSILRDIKRVRPDDYSVQQQKEFFANAKLIISPHGACLTNALFSNWDKLTLIEFTKQEKGGLWVSFKQDLRVEQHYVVKCPSPQNCTGNEWECDPWNTPIDLDVTNAVQIIQDILAGKHSVDDDIFAKGNYQSN